jgi:16S rRNA (uracil1498-N3)-methyltransferase
MHLFHSSTITGQTHLLDEQESKHAIRVLRLGKGDKVVLVDGQGGMMEILDGNQGCLLAIRASKTGQGTFYYLRGNITYENMESSNGSLKATRSGSGDHTAH